MDRISEPHDLLVSFLLLQRALERQGDLFFAGYDLTSAQFNILNLLANNGKAMDQIALTEKLLVGKSSISIVLNRMTKAGFIERREHAKDRRQSVLSLSPKGQKLWSKVSPKYEQSVREVFGRLPKARCQAFVDDLETIYAGLESESQVGGSNPLREIVKQLRSES